MRQEPVKKKVIKVIKKLCIATMKKFYGKNHVLVVPPVEDRKVPVTEVSAIGYSTTK